MKKVHTLILALSASIALHSQSVLNFTACTSGTITENSYDIISDQAGAIYISSNTNGVLKSTDNGVTFNNTSMLSSVGDMVALGNNIISYRKISTDGGTTWSNHNMFGTSYAFIKFIKQSETNAYAINNTGTYLKTTDGGLTWSTIVYSLPAAPGGTFAGFSIFTLNNGDIVVPFIGSTNDVYMISKDNLATYSYSITVSHSTFMYNSGYVDANGKYVFFKNDGSIHGYEQNQNLTAPTYTNSYTLTGAANTTSKFGRGFYSSNVFYVIDKQATTNCILKAETVVTSIDELSKLTVSLYPNPCVNNITINGLDKDYNYSIYNQLGQNVLQGSTNQQINTTTLISGIYFLNIANQKVVKFIKE